MFFKTTFLFIFLLCCNQAITLAAPRNWVDSYIGKNRLFECSRYLQVWSPAKKITEAEQITNDILALETNHSTTQNHAIRNLLRYFDKLNKDQSKKLIEKGIELLGKFHLPFNFDDFTFEVLSQLFSSFSRIDFSEDFREPALKFAETFRLKMKEYPQDSEALHSLLVKSENFIIKYDEQFHEELLDFFIKAETINSSHYRLETLRKYSETKNRDHSKILQHAMNKLREQNYVNGAIYKILENIIPRTSIEIAELPKTPDDIHSDTEALVFSHFYRLKKFPENEAVLSAQFLLDIYANIKSPAFKYEVTELIWKKITHPDISYAIWNSLLKIKFDQTGPEIILGEVEDVKKSIYSLRAASYARWDSMGLVNHISRLNDYENAFTEILNKATKIHFKLTLSIQRKTNFRNVLQLASQWSFRHLFEKLSFLKIDSYQPRLDRQGMPYVTEIELYQVLTHPEWLRKATFYDGNRILSSEEVETLLLNQLH